MTCEPDPCGVILKTGMQRFETRDGVMGLCKVTGDTFELLAVHVRPADKRKGLFRNFIVRVKDSFRVIKVWHVDNEFLPSVLVRYGFRPWQERVRIEGFWETNDGFRWDK